MSVPREIPERSRRLVRIRAGDRCERCRGARGTEWHHRRSRSVKDAHTHCPCNGVLLCKTCHDEVHAQPMQSRAEGFIVSRHSDPSATPFTNLIGWYLPKCDGHFNINTTVTTMDEAIEVLVIRRNHVQ